MTHPDEFTDTSSQAMEVWLNVLRNKKPGERMAMALAMTEFAIRVSESGVRARYPNASEREVFLRAAALRIPRDLMMRAYGWDPEGDGDPVE